MRNRFGFIGFGEVGSCFSEAMIRSGASVSAYDLLFSDPDRGEKTRERASSCGAAVAPLASLAEQSDFILSTVTTQTARQVAESCAKLLRPGQMYLDLNSTSPSVKIDLAGIIGASRADFVEGAILGAVGATGSKTRILLGGPKAPQAAESLTQHGLNASAYSDEIGKASMFKMLRSIFSKGLENLVLELMVAGKRAGIDQDLWEDVTSFMASKPFDKIAANWVQTHAVAHDRRYYEMIQVVETMNEIGVEPLMTGATLRFFERSMSLGFKEAFPEKPRTFREVVEFLESRLAAPVVTKC